MRPSRRESLALIAGAAVIPTGAVAQADPIFAALARCRTVEDAHFAASKIPDAAKSEAAMNAVEGMDEAREALALSVPATLAGLAALVAFTAEMSERYEVMFFPCEIDVMHSEGMDFLRSIDTALRALAVQS